MAVDPDHKWQETDDVAELRRKIDLLRGQVQAISNAWNNSTKDVIEARRQVDVLWTMLRFAVGSKEDCDRGG